MAERPVIVDMFARPSVRVGQWGASAASVGLQVDEVGFGKEVWDHVPPLVALVPGFWCAHISTSLEQDSEEQEVGSGK